MLDYKQQLYDCSSCDSLALGKYIFIKPHTTKNAMSKKKELKK
jgi:hypothetical protein